VVGLPWCSNPTGPRGKVLASPVARRRRHRRILWLLQGAVGPATFRCELVLVPMVDCLERWLLTHLVVHLGATPHPQRYRSPSISCIHCHWCSRLPPGPFPVLRCCSLLNCEWMTVRCCRIPDSASIRY
jgi:hypothetical protein